MSILFIHSLLPFDKRLTTHLVKADVGEKEGTYYKAEGRMIDKPQNQRSTYVKGLNIIRYSDGGVKNSW